MIGPGAVIKIVRSGGVIPKVVEVIKPAKMGSLPEGNNWHWDKNKVEIVFDDETISNDVDIITERIANGLLVLGVPSIRSGLVRKLVENGIQNLEVLMLNTKSDFIEAGLGNVQATTLRKGLDNALKTVNHATMMKASGLWPKGFGETIFNKVLAHLPYEQMVKLTARALYNDMVDNGVLKEATALKFAKEFKHYRKFVDSVDFVPVKRRVSKNDSLNGVNVAFTGFRNKSLEDIIKSRGAKVNSSVSKATNVLLVASKSHRSVKTDKAEKNGIEVIDLNTFLKKHKINL